MALGEARYCINRYLRQRGDTNIRNLDDLIAKSCFYCDECGLDTRFRDVKEVLEKYNTVKVLDTRERDGNRIAIQQVVMQAMMTHELGAVAYPTGNVPPVRLKAPVEPDLNGRPHQAWTLLGTMGFPAITVPAGFTTHVFDRIRDPGMPGGTRLTEAVPAKLPVGIDFLAKPFDEAKLFRIASAYEALTGHRRPPADFGPVAG
jgi:Asp-tRNA(Asn)/Glu-tRNA(Gln) amidotransferase A subunit family amidase